MSRLIDADAIPYTMLYKENWLAGTGCEEQGAWKDDIDAMPTIEERKKGEWIRVSADKYRTHSSYAFQCSSCKETFIGEWDYCPNCGARMKGE